MPRIPFGPWAPDRPDLDTSGLEDAVNVIPLDSRYYGPMTDVQAIAGGLATTLSSSVASAPMRGVLLLAASGSHNAFVGISGLAAASVPRIFKINATSGINTDVNRTATYTSIAEKPWVFTNYGNTVLASNGADPMQVYTLGTSTRFLDASASASAPIARALCTARDFVMAGGIVGAENTVQWSQINNPLRWTASPRLQSDSQVLPDTGDIIAMTGGDFVAILTERAVWRATYVGSPIIWRFDQVAPGVGCFIQGSVARYQNLTFFRGLNGFYVFDGQQVIPIGQDVDLTISGDFPDALSEFDKNRVNSAIDDYNKLYIVSYCSTATNDAYNNRMLVYNFVTQRWARATFNLRCIFPAGKLPVTTAVRRERGDLGILAINDSSVLVKFSGTTAATGLAKSAVLITGETQFVQDHRAFVSAIRPLVQAGSNVPITVSVGERNRLDETVSYGAAVAVNANGVAPLRSNARYHRVRLDISGSFTQAVGFEPTFRPAGKR